mgnify:CR=1 FL=1
MCKAISIFTGTNNFVSDTLPPQVNEYFGFTQKDVDQLLIDADVRKNGAGQVWYDGYHLENGCILSLGCDELFAGSSGESRCKADRILEKYQ